MKYRVYGSDEKGFSVSDVPYKVSIGISKELKPEFPANFIAETTATELAVMGCEVALPAANKTYYRVVAVDAQGKRSGPSDYATAPRPMIYGKPALRPRLARNTAANFRPTALWATCGCTARKPPTSGTSRSPSSPSSRGRPG